MIGLGSEDSNDLSLVESLFELGELLQEGRSRPRASSFRNASRSQKHYVQKLRLHASIKELKVQVMNIPSRNAARRFVDKRDVLREIWRRGMLIRNYKASVE